MLASLRNNIQGRATFYTVLGRGKGDCSQPRRGAESRACHRLSEKDGFFWMLGRETGKKPLIDWTYSDCFFAGFAEQHTEKAALEHMTTRPNYNSAIPW